MDDLRLMFNNCRQFNEEGSVIYEDANILERVLLDKAREIGLATAASAKPKRRSRGPNLQQKLKALYDAVREHRDLKGRQLASIFLKLPSKSVSVLAKSKHNWVLDGSLAWQLTVIYYFRSILIITK